MVKVRELTIQQINAALAEIQKAIDEILRRLQKLEEQSTNNT